MQIFEVGGAVRDRLLGLPVQDRDWVVVGSTPEAMIALGFKPVGRDFPVFLHPETHEEYALARTERKVSRGYHGFEFHTSPTVTLEEDLARRDLTINAMALDARGQLIDPYHGRDDLKAGILRHVGPAFSEDPVRILRVARFAARFDYRVADDTLGLMNQMVNQGEVEALVPERVSQEFMKALMERHVFKFFEILECVGALDIILPECRCLIADSVRIKTSFAQASDFALTRESRVALLSFLLIDPVSLAQRLKWSAHLTDLSGFVAKYRTPLLKDHWAASEAHDLLSLLEGADAFRRPQKLEESLSGAVCLATDLAQGKRAMGRVLKSFYAARAIDAGEIARKQSDPQLIPGAVREARRQAIETELSNAP